MSRSLDIRNPRTGKADHRITPPDLPAISPCAPARRNGWDRP